MPGTTHAPTPAEIRKIKNPTKRFHAARAAEPLMKRELSDIARAVVTELVEDGMARPAIATMLGISRQRVEQLVDPQVLAEIRVAKLEEREMDLELGLAKVRKKRRKAEGKDELEAASGQLNDEDVREILAQPDASEEDLAAQFSTSLGAIRYVRSERAVEATPESA